jgi:hypothetical protein
MVEEDSKSIEIVNELVENIPNTSNAKPRQFGYNYDSWIDFWEGKSGQTANKCSCDECGEKINLDGAHVSRVNDSLFLYKQYIIPLCSVHNNPNNKTPFKVSGTLVRIKQQKKWIN